MTKPTVNVTHTPEGRIVRLTGTWNFKFLKEGFESLREQLARLVCEPGCRWDLREIDALDSIGAFLLWQAWSRCMPSGNVEMRETHRALFEQWIQHPPVPAPPALHANITGMVTTVIGRRVIAALDHGGDALSLLGQLTLDALYLLRHPRRAPWREISATIYQAGAQALLITALVGVLIGVVVSYLSSLELRAYGAQSYVVKIVGIGVIRELGPILAAILVAGRSGSSMTAQLGVMRVTQELDALTAMGISRTLRLVLPKVIALLIAMPLLVVWTDLWALTGAMLVAELQLGIGFSRFLHLLPGAVPLANLWIGVGKGTVFGALIAMTAAHFGLRIEPNTESLGVNTTKAVVASIALVIIVDAIFAIMLRNLGLT